MGRIDRAAPSRNLAAQATASAGPSGARMTPVVLTLDQELALAQIVAAQGGGNHHLLTGYAGSGKTTLMQDVVREFSRQRLDLAVSAPTHKAVAVLRRKLAEAGLADAPCSTIHKLLGLRVCVDGAGTKLEHSDSSKSVDAQVVIVDECSMLDAELMWHIRQTLGHCFVLFVGDPAQLPPVGEIASNSFGTRSRSHLDTIVRQAAGNPLLDAAHVIRQSQGGPLDWSWCRSAKAPPMGVFVPERPDAWLRHAFMSTAFQADNDAFRYLCWTNERVAEVNLKVRRWLYGDIEEPFAVGERALLRSPLFVGEVQVFSTNEEAKVLAIKASHFSFPFEKTEAHGSWGAVLASWEVTLEAPGGGGLPVHMARSQRDLDCIDERLRHEAKASPLRWTERFAFNRALARLQSVYALTVHCAQGSTFRTAFVDVGDIRRRAKSNPLECQQLLYVAATRPSESLVLVGAGDAA